MSRSATATIHLDALRANLARVRMLAEGAKVMAVVKADAYGHGLERCARALAGADAFGVASIADGLRLRAAGHRQRIVVLSGPDAASDLAEMRRLQLEAVVHHESQLAMLEAEQGGDPLKVWLNLDTGMHRLGFPPGRAHAMRARLAALPAVDKAIVLMTHFASSDEFDNDFTARQTECFRNATQDIPGERALSNSAGLLGWPQARENWVRIGGLLYGLSVATGKTGADFGFAPAMTLTTRLVAVNHIARGERVGYGATWECPEDMRIGVAAIGYGDGYPRSAPSGTPVRVGDAPVAVIGRVSMDLLTLDLRQAPNARVGDEVVLWGPQLPVEVIAQHANTISYELTCGVTRRVLFAEDGG
ncbi:MAG: alanine racemase [Xanthomonadales bacterium]|nr:alanine racemase [Xanthomonadales bacterium]ODU93358.1 MAG: alanine racemase [Rhodanobacter sp. SCN 66-43]OJY83115.1 MAG: alanine racemase [Xanthomonadales bacterium 66-474]